jgi:MinD-like ATPase involved in chromosome partitioning or flagellar assembly
MPRVVFWSPAKSTTGNTHTAIAVSTLMGIAHKTSCLMMQGNYNSKKIESSFTPYDDLKSSKVFDNSSIGINALIRLVTSNKLTSDAIQNYAKPVLKDRLDILYGMNSKDIEGYSDLVNNLPYITRKAAEIYDIVFIDLPKGSDEKFILDTLADAEIVVCVVNQDCVKLDDFFDIVENMEVLKNKNKIFVVGDYENKARFNTANIKLKTTVKDRLYTVPHNYLFADACNSGSVIDFFYKNINANKNDYNGHFIQQTLEIVEKIIEISKIKDN